MNWKAKRIQKQEALKLLKEVIRLERMPDAFHTLALVYDAIGEKRKTINFYQLAAEIMPRDTSLWKLLLSWYLEQGNVAAVDCYLPKAIAAEPEDIHSDSFLHPVALS
ncbi:hypothetical protein K7X08_034422 [Anisodus acutangulus]|uniref:Uncharacterized protein n=2 Tax=Anisodus TaxID=243963 RepID=A0A9Q1LIS4_9SOLA|nr:hypothetical protein K7X08_034422 [Anisodus acutangulus]KAK4350025.1 hypothetical protein RND71_029338 [Anisodus tanguticus]